MGLYIYIYINIYMNNIYVIHFHLFYLPNWFLATSGSEMDEGPQPNLFSAVALKMYSFPSISLVTGKLVPFRVEVMVIQPISSFLLSFFSKM